jgi:hypothetical protein
MTPTSLFIGIHRVVDLDIHDPASAVGLAIDAGTRLRWGGLGGAAPPGGWILDAPSTHAFVVVADEATAMRVDAFVPAVTAEPWTSPAVPTALWQVLPMGDVDPAAGARAALDSVGTPYDLVQAVMQALSILARPLPNPFNSRFLPHPTFTAHPGRVICTEAACRALKACGGPAAELADRVMEDDHFPEELGAQLQAAMGEPWLKRVGLMGPEPWLKRVGLMGPDDELGVTG